MHESVFDQPTPEQIRGFIEGDPIAIDEVMRLVLPQLYRWAVRQYSGLSEPDVCSVVNQVAAEICANHGRYDPTKASFTTYAIRLIVLRLKDLYAAEKRIADNQQSESELHEKLPLPRYNQSNTADDDTRIAREEFFQLAASQLEDVERDFLCLMREGEKSQATFTEVLARYGDITDPAREVKNTKERLVRKLRAIAHDQGHRLEDLL